ncbi:MULTISPECIES: arsenate reductase [unclassified Paludibacterium]|uniref:arsenate reductase n=1 Tax=unclassified Paludibacterium TaxID=2618429 RepID=UPI001C0597AC|nr:arsenate reductase [Paludibacterium sp. B53371]BEV70678.1 ArsC family reductase [Paludibacterium sp. THUN1379]
MTIVYGIPNCASVKKARQWLEAQGIDYTFHDFKKLGIDSEHLTRWVSACGLDRVLNRKGTTWRALSESEKSAADTLAGALTLMETHTSLIKRPVIVHQGGILLGFDAPAYQEAFGR